MSFNIKTDIFSVERKTKSSLLWSCLLNESLVSFLGIMPFLLRKNLLAGPFQISLFTMLKPSVAVLSFYWSSRIVQSKQSLKNNLVIAGVLARVFFLFFVFFDNVWYMIFASAIYTLFSRASIPAWMEILKLNLKKQTRDRFFSLGSIFGYTESVFIAFFIGSFLDVYSNGWKIFLFSSSLLGLVGVYLQAKTPICLENVVVERKKRINLESILKPWKDGIDLMKKRPDFLRFQIGTTFIGFGLMMITPALAFFYADTLNLSHTRMIIGRYVFMGLGFVFSSSLWAKAMQKFSFNYLTGLLCFGFAVYPLFVLCAFWGRFWVYIAFLSYGIAQAGCHLIWNLSGPTFAEDGEDSSIYSGINVLMVGLRGIVAPLLGGILCNFFGAVNVFLITFVIFVVGGYYMLNKKTFNLKVEA